MSCGGGGGGGGEALEVVGGGGVGAGWGGEGSVHFSDLSDEVGFLCVFCVRF